MDIRSLTSDVCCKCFFFENEFEWYTNEFFSKMKLGEIEKRRLGNRIGRLTTKILDFIAIDLFALGTYDSVGLTRGGGKQAVSGRGRTRHRALGLFSIENRRHQKIISAVSGEFVN